MWRAGVQKSEGRVGKLLKRMAARDFGKTQEKSGLEEGKDAGWEPAKSRRMVARNEYKVNNIILRLRSNGEEREVNDGKWFTVDTVQNDESGRD